MKKLFILMIALSMVGMFTAQALADVDLYGSARMWTFSDKKTPSSLKGGSTTDDTDTLWVIGPFSRFGASFKSGDIGGKMELDTRDTGAGAATVGTMRIRHLYGTWNFGSGEMLVGQTWPITDLPVAGLQRSGGGLQPYGGMGADIARVPQIRFTFGGFALGFLTPWTSGTVESLPAGYTDIDTTLPKIEAVYRLALGDHQLAFSAGYASYDIEDNAASQSQSIDSWVTALRGKFNFGPAYLNAIVNYSINPENYGKWQGTGIHGTAAWDGSTVKDYKLLGFAFALGYKINDMFSIEAGYGKNDGEWDLTGTWEQDNSAYYVNLPITLAPGVKIVPEFAKFDYGETNENGTEYDDGEQTSFGAVWYISF